MKGDLALGYPWAPAQPNPMRECSPPGSRCGAVRAGSLATMSSSPRPVSIDHVHAFNCKGRDEKASGNGRSSGMPRHARAEIRRNGRLFTMFPWFVPEVRLILPPLVIVVDRVQINVAGRVSQAVAGAAARKDRPARRRSRRVGSEVHRLDLCQRRLPHGCGRRRTLVPRVHRRTPAHRGGSLGAESRPDRASAAASRPSQRRCALGRGRRRCYTSTRPFAPFGQLRRDACRVSSSCKHGSLAADVDVDLAGRVALLTTHGWAHMPVHACRGFAGLDGPRRPGFRCFAAPDER
jgi:hypothetical protein